MNESINTIRTLAIDAVQQAIQAFRRGPWALRQVGLTRLGQKFLRYDVRPIPLAVGIRFVLSAGHASMLLYATAPPPGRAVNAKGEVTVRFPNDGRRSSRSAKSASRDSRTS